MSNPNYKVLIQFLHAYKNINVPKPDLILKKKLLQMKKNFLEKSFFHCYIIQ